MKKVSCKMKNSFAIDNESNLYSWGAYDSGLLGRDEERDVDAPQLVELKDGYDLYACQGVSAGHFHVAVIANRINTFNGIIPDTKYAYVLFDNLYDWYNNIFIKNLSSVESLIKLLLMYNENSTDPIAYSEFEKCILLSFFSLQNFNKKSFYNMQAAYKELFCALLSLSSNKMHFPIEDLVDSIIHHSTQEVKELYNYLKRIFEHFRNLPSDFPYFLLLIFRFEKDVTDENIFLLFQYLNSMKSTLEKKEDNKIISKLFVELKRPDNKINTYLLIEQILKKPTGVGAVFTWGGYSESRLGYTFQEEEKNSNEEILLQKIPRLVKFPNLFTKITSISCGYSHSLALSEEGIVYSWGSCKFGCLGNSHSVDNIYPLPIVIDYLEQPFRNITQIAAGMYFSLALGSSKEVYSWGCGISGRLGHADENTVSTPKLIKYFKNNEIKVNKISAGDTHCAVITSNKEIYTWGNGSYGKLGHMDYDDAKVPMFVEFFRDKIVDSVECGSCNTVAITTDKKLYAWGKNTHGMLGVANLTSTNITVPEEITFQQEDSSLLIENISLGTIHSLFLSAEGSVYTCGSNTRGILGIKQHNEVIANPIKIPDKSFYKNINDDIRVKPIFKNYSQEFTINLPRTEHPTGLIFLSCSTSNTAFITSNNELYMSGDASLICEDKSYKSKYNGNKTNKLEKYKVLPVKLSNSIISGKVTYVAIGTNHVICVADKKAFSWGVNRCGVLGLESAALNDIVKEPRCVEKILSQIRMVCVSDTHSMFLTTTGEIYSCGSSMYGKLGIGETKFSETLTGDIEIYNELIPKLVRGITVAEYIACSNHHSACIMKISINKVTSYSIFTWGGGYAGKLGRIDGKDSNTPTYVEIRDHNPSKENQPIHFIQLALGNEFTIALDIEGRMWGWGKVKYLGANIKGEEIYSTPKLIHSNKKFKYVNSSSTYTLAIDIEGNIYGWGKNFSFKEKSDFLTIDRVNCDKAELVSCGINHYAAIDHITYSPYTWGNNLFKKCGQTFAKPGESEFEYNQQLPKKIQFFYDKFLKNQEKLKKENQVSNEIENKKQTNQSPKIEIQKNLFEEPIDLKNFGILSQDYSINLKFYQVLNNYFESMKLISEMRSKKQLEAENKIISVINKTNCKKNNEFINEIPKIISKNFQLYETFFTILHNHPCQFLKVKQIMPNKNSFLELIKNSFGGSELVLKNKRIILTLTGLWNAVIKEESKENKLNNLKNTDNFEDYITYDLYSLIFNLDDENQNVVHDIIAEVFILFIHEILSSSKDFVDPNKEKDILLLYNDLPNLRKEMFGKVVTVIANNIKISFSQLNNSSKLPFSIYVLMILKKISKLFPIKTNLEKHCKIFNFFLFSPFVEFLRKIKNSNKICKESKIIAKKIPELLEKAKKRGEYTELYNLYKSHKKVIETKFFSLISSPNSDLLSFLLAIFESLSKNEKFEYTNRLIKDMNQSCSASLKNYKSDFTLEAIKEQIQLTTANGNESYVISIKIKDLIEIENIFCSLNEVKDAQSAKEENSHQNSKVFKVILTELSNLKKLDELDPNSPIRNFVLNFYIKPNLLFYHSNSANMIKCENCLLPIHSAFYDQGYVEKCIYGTDWFCSYCKKNNRPENLKCVFCKKLKSKNELRNVKTIFKNFIIPEDDPFIQLYEDVLYNLNSLNLNQDIVDEVVREKERLLSLKDSDENEKIEMFEKFLDIFEKLMEQEDKNVDNQSIKFLKFEELNRKVTRNYEKRKKHAQYLDKIKELLNTMAADSHNAKSKSDEGTSENQTSQFIQNIRRGYANHFAKDKIPNYLQKYLRDEKYTEKRNSMKRFICKELINKKIIDEILFNNQKQDSLINKSSIVFEKQESGYEIKLSYKEKTSKFGICGDMTNEYVINKDLLTNNHILEMRKNARHNPTWNSSDVRFNVFYLIKLLNQLETES